MVDIEFSMRHALTARSHVQSYAAMVFKALQYNYMEESMMTLTKTMLCAPAVLALLARPAVAQSFPEKPIRIAVSSPGSGSDTTARIIAQISNSIGQPVVMDYRGAGLLTGEYVA